MYLTKKRKNKRGLKKDISVDLKSDNRDLKTIFGFRTLIADSKIILGTRSASKIPLGHENSEMKGTKRIPTSVQLNYLLARMLIGFYQHRQCVPSKKEHTCPGNDLST